MLSSPFALTLPAVALGSLACKVELHWTEKDVVVVSARSIPHSFPRVENLEQVCTLLEIDTTGHDAPYCADRIEAFVRGDIPADFGHIDWSSFLEAHL